MKLEPTIVIVTERRLFPVNDGTRARIVTFIRSLRALGFSVVLVARRPSGLMDAVQTRWLVDRLVPVDARGFAGGSPLAFDCEPFRGPLRSAVERFSPVAVIAEYIWMAPCLRAVPAGVLRMVDTIDLMHVRDGFRDRLSDVWVTCSREEERALLEEADTVIAIQPRELAHFREIAGGRRVICVPHSMQVQAARVGHHRPTVAIVGSGNPGNVEGMTAFLERAWPVVLRESPDAKLLIFGELARVAPHGPNVVPIGYVRNLRAAYRQAAVVINPVCTGTGLKIKTVEALAHGKALVTTSCGAEGLEAGSGRAFLVEDEWTGFAAAIAALLKEPDRRARLESAAALFAGTEFSRARVYRSLLETLDTATSRASLAADQHSARAIIR